MLRVSNQATDSKPLITLQPQKQIVPKGHCFDDAEQNLAARQSKNHPLKQAHSRAQNWAQSHRHNARLAATSNCRPAAITKWRRGMRIM